MNLSSAIFRRRSCRSYDMQPLEPEVFNKIKDAIKSFEPLYSDHPLSWRFTDKVKGRFHVKAPHYLIVSGQSKPDDLENCGFLFEQLVLWFDLMELGCVWLGESKDSLVSDTKDDIIAIGFGRSDGPIHRLQNEFKRKPIGSITDEPDDSGMKAVHLAPSGMNLQPWYFKHQNARVLVYKQKLRFPFSRLYKLSDLDMGIALCHYALVSHEAGKPFHFHRATEMSTKEGYEPFGIIG